MGPFVKLSTGPGKLTAGRWLCYTAGGLHLFASREDVFVIHLLPIPRSICLRDDTYGLAGGKRIVLQGGDDGVEPLLFAGQMLQRTLLESAGVEWALAAGMGGQAAEIGMVLRIAPERVAHAQGYELLVAPSQITVDAHDAAGAFYGVCTLSQLLRSISAQPGLATALPCLQISDWPDFAARGVLLDVSRDKVPTMDTLYQLVDLLASWKVNQFQLYTEHTFAYRNHPDVWAGASPLTAQEILELDAYCRQRHVDLVPNQNSFGHMQRWLRHPRYAPLAEIPDPTASHWWGDGPFGLCPVDPGSIDLLRSLYDELLPNFSSGMANIGCDETFDLGLGRSKEQCDARGAGRVYLDFLLQVFDAVRTHGRKVQFWGDIITQHPELIPELPADAIALEWGYEADHPFDDDAARFAAAGIPFYVCPGTSSWNSIAGRTDNALGNILNAAECGLRHGAIGLLNTDWGDNGHWQFTPAVSYLPYAMGAAASWALEANRHLDLVQGVALFAFGDRSGAAGRVAYDLGNVYTALDSPLVNASGLFFVFGRPLAELAEVYPVPRHAFEHALGAIERAVEPMTRGSAHQADSVVTQQEFATAARMLRHGARRGLLALEGDPGRAAALARDLTADMESLIPQYEALWLARNRPGGLCDSVARLRRAADAYHP